MTRTCLQTKNSEGKMWTHGSFHVLLSRNMIDKVDTFWLVLGYGFQRHFQQYFSYILADSFIWH